MRDILETAVRPAERVKLCSLLAKIGREAGALTDEDIARFERLRDPTPSGV